MKRISYWLETRVTNALRGMVGLGGAAKLAILVAIDSIMCVAAAWFSFFLRFGELQIWSPAIQQVAVTALAVWFVIFIARGGYRSVVRFAGTRTMVGIASSCMILMTVLALLFTLRSVEGIPRTVAIIQPLVFAVFLMMSRLSARYLLFDLLNQKDRAGKRQNVMIYGAGAAGRQLAVSLRHETNIVLHGYIDDNELIKGKQIDGVRVYSSVNSADLLARLDIDMVVLAVPGASRRRREQILRKFDGIPVKVMTPPTIGTLLDGSVSINDMREIDISDLLGRDPVEPDRALLDSLVAGKSVMVTGAGGSIGSELCRQIARLSPATIILVEMTEHTLYLIESELRQAQQAGRIDAGIKLHAELSNIADPHTVERLFERCRPDTVLHAAAYKHVPLVEDNVLAGIRNNIFSTLHCGVSADSCGVKNFILVSTDKAVRPTNVMGASKRACELIIQGLAARGSKTRFAIVRFGNVLGSSGSVVPRFKQQIRDGGPVTLTHNEVTRYFMTIPEAAELVIQAGAMAEGGEVYVLDMGEPIRIYDLACKMINLSGQSVRSSEHPNGDIEIVEIGLRKGEKLHEELLIGNSPRTTRHPQIMQARESFLPWDELLAVLQSMKDAAKRGDRQVALELLCRIVPEYQGEQSVPPAPQS